MRILVMGTGGFAVPTFEALMQSNHEVVGLVTRPPRPVHSHRKTKTAPNPMREVAERYGLTVAMPLSVNAPEAIASIAKLNVDLLIVCDYGQILSSAALATARLGGINLHASLLPRYRGAAPINWALYHGESVTGVTVIHMTAKLDAGPSLIQTSTPISATEDAVALERRLAEMGAQTVLDALEMLAAWNGESPLGELQNPSLVSKAPRLKKSDGQVDWSRAAQQIVDQVRAFKPWPGTFTTWQMGQKSMRLVLQQVEVAKLEDAEATPGTIAHSDRSQTIVACGQGGLRLIEVQPASKKPMPIADFLRGHPLSIGDSIT